MAKIAILGFGVVGQGVYEVLSKNSKEIKLRTGQEITVSKILDKRSFPDHPMGPFVTQDFNDILNDPEITVVAETMGGTTPAFQFSLALLKAGKSVVTSNKAVVEKHGDALLRQAAESGAAYLYEASAGGGIPVIHPILHCLSANKISSVCGILNGTTNYILTKMRDEGTAFEAALKQAQQLGYAEADPTADISGMDSARKICILASIAFNKTVSLSDVSLVEGIEGVTGEDVAAAAEKGFVIKLVGYAEEMHGQMRLFVAPCLVRKDTVLGITDDVVNAVYIYGNAVGGVSFRGRGAGGVATASAVASDIIECVTQTYTSDIRLESKKEDFVCMDDGKDRIFVPETGEIIPAAPLKHQKNLLNGKKFYRIIDLAE